MTIMPSTPYADEIAQLQHDVESEDALAKITPGVPRPARNKLRNVRREERGYLRAMQDSHNVRQECIAKLALARRVGRWIIVKEVEEALIAAAKVQS